MSDKAIDATRGTHVRIRLDGNGIGSVEINGIDVAGVTSATRLFTEAGKPPRLELSIWCELLEVEGPVAELVKLIESAEAAADAKVIGVTEHGDLVHAAPDGGKALAETVARKLPGVLAKKGLPT